MVRRHSRRGGFSVLEGAISVVLLSVIATTVATTGAAELRYFARSHEETVAGRVAASRIEVLSTSKGALPEGAAAFPISPEAARRLHGATATQTVTRVEAGLYRVETEVTWLAADGGTARAHLATLIAREASK